MSEHNGEIPGEYITILRRIDNRTEATHTVIGKAVETLIQDQEQVNNNLLDISKSLRLLVGIVGVFGILMIVMLLVDKLADRNSSIELSPRSIKLGPR